MRDKNEIELAGVARAGSDSGSGVAQTTSEPLGGRESIGRIILVIEEQPYLWAALRQRIDPGLAYVRSATPGEVPRVWRSCQPWPWLVAGGSSGELPAGVADLVAAHPIPVHWVGEPPPGLPGQQLVHRDWTELVAALDRLRDLAQRGLHGVRLLRNRGLLAPDGRIVLDAVNVEGLLAAPAGLALPANGASAVEAELAASGLPLRLERTGGVVRLV